jgi:hypothetical protein
MQQHERGATLFHLQVAPRPAFSDKTASLRLFVSKPVVFIRKSTKKVLFHAIEEAVGRVAPTPIKKRVAPGCTRIVLQLILPPA